MPEPYPRLFSPVVIGRMELKNRAVMPAMGTGYGGRDGQVTDRLVAYLKRRAAGGVGLIITEVCAIDRRGKGFPSELGLWGDEFIEGFARLADTIHAEGGKVAAQLHHAGRETFKAVTGAVPEAPSALPSVIMRQPCEAMSRERIGEVVVAFAAAAGRTKAAGLDAVEIHGAHGYLLNQFLSPFSNQRVDEYGGSDENRARFVIEIVRATRAAVGPDFPVIVRLSAEEVVAGGYAIDFTRWLAPRLIAAGADAIHASVGVYSTPGNLSIAGFDTEPGFNLGRARALKEAVSVPVIAVGRIHDPALAEAALEAGDCDLVSFGRQHLCDPDFLVKAKRGERDRIRFCLACNQGCIERLSFEMRSITCSINPECGQENRGETISAEPPKKVLVIGAGPAGLAAALASSARGHQVTVVEREAEVGGQLRPASRPPRKEGYLAWVKWAERELFERGVTILTATDVTKELLASQRPEAVILASGAHPASPALPGLDLPHVVDARDLLLGRFEPAGPAVILGAGHVGMETADWLIARGIAVTLVELKKLPPVNAMTARGYWLHRRLKKSGGELILGASVLRVELDAVVCATDAGERRLSAGMVVKALGAAPETGLAITLTELGIPFVAVGDAVSPRRILEAVQEGDKAGREIGS